MARRRELTPRSEIIRENRNKKRPHKKVNQDRRFDSGVREMPPVMARSGVLAPINAKKKKGKSKVVKRRYDIPLDTPGVEIRLPAIPSVKIGWRLLSFTLTLGLIALLYFMWTSPMFQVQVAEVNGVNRLNVMEINQALDVNNKPVFTLHPKHLEESLILAFPELVSASVSIGLPAQIFVDLAERVPLIAWHQDTIVHWVDGEGFAFQPRGEVSNLVSVQAFTLPPKPDSMEIEESTFDFIPSPKAFMFPEMVNAILTIRSQVPQESELIYDQQYGLGWVDPRGWEVYFGTNVTDYDMKIIVYQNIVDRLQADGITPAIINVEHVHAPYFRLER